MYIHEQSDWPAFTWEIGQIAYLLAETRHRQGTLLGRMETLGFTLREEAVLETLTLDVIKSSEIEGEMLEAGQVRSSIARRLGMEVAGVDAIDRHIEGVVDMMLDATRHFTDVLTEDRLYGWQSSLFPAG